jgi:hypothetical protein
MSAFHPFLPFTARSAFDPMRALPEWQLSTH